MFKKHVFLGLALLLSTIALAQSKYSAHELFHPLWNYGPVSSARSAAGVPGPGYWQNSADYKIAVSLDDVANKITGDVEITYKNNSPDKLPFFVVAIRPK